MGRSSRASSSSSRSMMGGEHWTPILYNCGVEAPLVTSWSADNHGRRFYGCGLYKVNGRRMCNFFVWYEKEKENCKEKKLISELFKKIEEMKQREMLLLFSLVVCIVLIFAMGVSMGICSMKK